MRPVTVLAVFSAFAFLTACGEEETLAIVEDPKPQPQASSSAPNCAVIESTNWQAWVDTMPGPDSKPTLHVTGEVVLPTPGYDIAWRIGPLDRMQPPAQRLYMDVTAPDGMVAQVITTVAVAYAGETPITNYRAIIVGCGDEVLATISDVTMVQ